MEREVSRIEKAFSAGQSYEEVMTPKMVSRYMEKKYNISDKLIELLLKAKGLEITYENKQKLIGQCMTSRRIANLPRQSLIAHMEVQK